MSERNQNILKTLHSLSADLDAMGWDQPARIYHLIEDENDPIARLAGILPTYPPDDMLAAYDQGMRMLPGKVFGLVIASEGYRHLFIEEVMERNPQMKDRILEAVAEGNATIDPEEVEEVLARHYYDHMVPKLPSPSQMPPFMRCEVRMVCAVLLDGTTITHSSSKEKDDADGSVIPRELITQQRIPCAMYMFLHGVRPDADCPDPLTVVEDHKTLEVLASLPVKED